MRKFLGPLILAIAVAHPLIGQAKPREKSTKIDLISATACDRVQGTLTRYGNGCIFTWDNQYNMLMLDPKDDKLCIAFRGKRAIPVSENCNIILNRFKKPL